MKRITKTCECCGEDFSIPQCRDWRERSCSSSCKARIKEQRARESRAYRSRACVECGARFIPRWTQIRLGQGRYCSNKCGVVPAVEANMRPEARAKMAASMAKAREEGRIVPLRGEDHPFWKGGRWIAQGYVYIRVDGTPVLEHRHLMEMHLGRRLDDHEVVHHINHDKTDNRLENLQVMTRAEHLIEHLPDLLAGRGLA